MSIMFAVASVCMMACILIGAFAPKDCRCGRTSGWLLQWRHERLRWLVAYAGSATCATVFTAAPPGTWIAGVIWGAISVYGWLIVWIHERDRMKQATKALGRVVVDAAGRLVVRPEPVRAAA